MPTRCSNAPGKSSQRTDAMNRAFEAKDRAYNAQQSAWQDYQRVKSSNSPRIDSLNSQQESAFQNMKRAYDNASSAYDRRDGASASSYAAEGRSYKEESQRYVARRRRLVEEIRSARSRLGRTSWTSSEPRTNLLARGQRSRPQNRSTNARRPNSNSPQSRVRPSRHNIPGSADEKVKAENKKRSDDRRSIAEKAGVPYRVLRQGVGVQAVRRHDQHLLRWGWQTGWSGHGHYVLDRNGKVTYKRDPYDPHGTQNFTDKDDSPGGTLYDRRARSGRSHLAQKVFSPDMTVVANTQRSTMTITTDFRRISSTAKNVKRHWTNQNARKKSPNRHVLTTRRHLIRC